MTHVVAVVAALAGGAAICVQSLFSGTLGERIGIVESVFVVHAGGLALAALLLLGARGGNLSAWRSVPWYVLCAGFLGVGIVAAVSYTVPCLGLAGTLTLTIVAQLALGAVLDHFGWLGAVPRAFDATRALGMGVLFLGTWLILR